MFTSWAVNGKCVFFLTTQSLTPLGGCFVPIASLSIYVHSEVADLTWQTAFRE
jgi:hypothetical protein